MFVRVSIIEISQSALASIKAIKNTIGKRVGELNTELVTLLPKPIELCCCWRKFAENM